MAEAALTHVREARTPSEPRPASTVILLRDTAAGPEVYLLRRQLTMAFAAERFRSSRMRPDSDANRSVIVTTTSLTSAVSMRGTSDASSAAGGRADRSRHAPAEVTRTRYGPGGTAGDRKRPSASGRVVKNPPPSVPCNWMLTRCRSAAESFELSPLNASCPCRCRPCFSVRPTFDRLSLPTLTWVAAHTRSPPGVGAAGSRAGREYRSTRR